MVEESVFRGVIDFLGKIGMYDIILPFLLIFTIVFAILDKTKILGIDKINDREYSKKNLNAIVAFVVAMLVVASTQLVGYINTIMANVVLLIILAVCFLLLVGVFFKEGEFNMKDHPKWMKFFMFFMFLGIVVIFLNTFTYTTDAGETHTFLEVFLNIFLSWDETWAAAIIFFLVIIGFIYYITKEPAAKPATKD